MEITNLLIKNDGFPIKFLNEEYELDLITNKNELNEILDLVNYNFTNFELSTKTSNTTLEEFNVLSSNYRTAFLED